MFGEDVKSLVATVFRDEPFERFKNPIDKADLNDG